MQSAEARPTYQAYHAEIARHVSELRAAFPQGALLLDIHGQSEDLNTTFRGTRAGLTVKALVQKHGIEAIQVRRASSVDWHQRATTSTPVSVRHRRKKIADSLAVTLSTSMAAIGLKALMQSNWSLARTSAQAGAWPSILRTPSLRSSTMDKRFTFSEAGPSPTSKMIRKGYQRPFIALDHTPCWHGALSVAAIRLRQGTRYGRDCMRPITTHRSLAGDTATRSAEAGIGHTEEECVLRGCDEEASGSSAAWKARQVLSRKTET